MAVFLVETYVIKPEKQADFPAHVKKFLAWKEKRTELFKEAKSFKMFAQMFGGNMGGYVEMFEFENLADLEKCFNRVMQDKEFMTTISSEFATFVVPATDSINIWNSVT